MENVKPTFIGIVGGTGAGKSTLCNLLQEKYPNPKHILYELVMTAKAEEYRRQETEIQKFWEITGR